MGWGGGDGCLRASVPHQQAILFLIKTPSCRVTRGTRYGVSDGSGCAGSGWGLNG